MMRIGLIGVVGIFVLNVAACGTVVTNGGATTTGNATSSPSKEEVVGHWGGDWGAMELRVVGDEIWGAYDHDEGTVRGTFVDGVFRGWWSEIPSREATDDAGEVEFRFSHDANGALVLDGRWRYGGDPAEWHDDWDLSMQTSPISPALSERFADPSAFRAHP